MIVERKDKLLTLHAFLQLRLAYAVIVHAYECHVRRNTMAVNRLLLVFRDDGRGECVLGASDAGQALTMRAGALYFVPCHLAVDLDITPGVSFVSLHFNLDLLYGFDVFSGHLRCEMLEDPALVAQTRALMDRQDELGTLCRVNELIFGLCAAWLPDRPADLQGRLADHRKYEGVLRFVRQAGDATTTVQTLAAMQGMRSDVFSRRFTRDMGVTPKAFVTKALMRKASHMLLSPGATVRDVAAALNFSSEYYFSRFFKKHSGQPPTAFQRESGMHARGRGPAVDGRL